MRWKETELHHQIRLIQSIKMNFKLNSSARGAPKSAHQVNCNKIKAFFFFLQWNQRERGLGKKLKKMFAIQKQSENGKHEARDELGRVSRTHWLTWEKNRGIGDPTVEPPPWKDGWDWTPIQKFWFLLFLKGKINGYEWVLLFCDDTPAFG